MRRRALGSLVGSFGLFALSVQGCSAQTTGQLVVVVQTDLSLPKDIDAIEIDVSVDGVPKFKNAYEKLGTPDGQIHLPGTINLLAPPDPTSAVDIIVSARSGGKEGLLRILDEVVTTVPEDRAATLQVPLQFLCDGQATFQAGNPVTTCPKGQTCVAGTCITNKVDPKTLPNFTDASVFGDGSCSDVGRCFDAAPIVDVDPKGCSFASKSPDLNVALETQGDGICGAVGCFVALDADGNATHVYWANFAEDGEVMRLDLSGGKPEVIGHGTRPNGIAVDDTNVYWTNRGDGTVMKLAKNAPANSPPTMSASNQAAPGAIAADAKSVYWINAGPSNVSQGAIVKLDKGE